MDHTEGQGELTTAEGFRVDDALAGLKPRPEDEALNRYEAKQEAKRRRLERAADNAAAESAARFQRARDAVRGIEFGQPILVGHHSEKRHRAALRRQDTNLRAAVEADKRASELARRAAAVGAGGISSDDPAAVAKLTDKRTALEQERDRMKAANVYYRKHKTLDGWDGPAALAEDGRTNLRVWGGVYAVPFPAYCLTNIGAAIRRAAKRAASLAQIQEAAQGQESPDVETVNGVEIITDLADHRVLVKFPARLSKDDYKVVRSFGFVWSPTRSAFVRKFTGPGVVAIARRMVEGITQGSG